MFTLAAEAVVPLVKWIYKLRSIFWVLNLLAQTVFNSVNWVNVRM